MRFSNSLWLRGALLLFTSCLMADAAEAPIRTIRQGSDAARSTLRIRAGARSSYVIPKEITGKFAEHLGANIYNGMDAQILRNPTLADYPFWTGQMSPDGVTKFYADEEKISQQLRQQAARWGWPESEMEGLITARRDGLACWWTREGGRESVQVSPDTGPYGGRAQRLQITSAGAGIAQWVYLPAHRTRKYEVEVLARSSDLQNLSAALWSKGATKPLATMMVKGLTANWQTLRASLEIPAATGTTDFQPDASCRFTLTANSPGQIVIARILLRPADQIGGADPDIVRLLKESRLPLLRWPGGNFVSGYHWEDGVGSSERRPTLPNYAWGGVEPNLFGTDEFVGFCRAVGCDPMICINAGNGTPEEAARWVQYCNGPARSPMGSRRAANGHPQPYNIRRWEVGNELWGRWQFHWTTAAGYADRYAQFSKAMLAADPKIKLYACGAPVLWGKDWNTTIITTAPRLSAITDHPLIGGQVSPTVDPLDVFRDFMAVPEVLESKWSALQGEMLKAHIPEPRLAVTELQMFAHLDHPSDGDASARLTHENLVSPGTHAEGLYDVLIYHAAVRLGRFVELVTHSAIVNHGGGLRKEHERVYANPCHYAQAAFAMFAGARSEE